MKSILVLSAGALMALSSLAHGLLGWRAMRGGLASTNAPSELVAALATGWSWGSVAMAAFGSIVIVHALRWRRGDSSGITAIRLVAAAYVAFGLAAFVANDLNPHFLILFFGVGCLAGLPTLMATARG